MDKPRTQPLHSSSMQVARTSPLQLLLQTCRDSRARSHVDETYRRDLHRIPVQWISKNYPQPSKRRSKCEPKTGSEDHAATWLSRTAPEAEHFEESPGTPQISVSAARSLNHQTSAGVEFGYHLHSIAPGFCVSCGSHGLVQSVSTFSSSIEQSRGELLHRSIRGGHRELWPTRNLQHRSRSAVFISRVCGCCSQEEHSFQHGRSRESARQHLCRTTMENSKI